MGTEDGMGNFPASSVGSDDVLQVEGKWPYLLRCEPGHFFILFLFFLVGVHFFQGLDEVDLFDVSLSRLR